MNLFAEFHELIGSILRRIAAKGRLPENLDLQRIAVEPPHATHGELSTNAAMVYAKEARPHFANPRQLAVEMAAELADNPDVAEAAVAGPGFLNIRKKPAVFARVSRAANALREFPRLCRGGSRSLTFPGVHRGITNCEQPSAREEIQRWMSMQA